MVKVNLDILRERLHPPLPADEEEKLTSSLDLALNRFPKIPDHKRRALLEAIKENAQSFVYSNAGDDKIEMRLATKILFFLRDIGISDTDLAMLNQECKDAIIDVRKGHKHIEKKE